MFFHTRMFLLRTPCFKSDSLKGCACEEIKTFEVHADGEKCEHEIPKTKLQQGWAEYDKKFKEHLENWRIMDLTQDQLARQVIEAAAELRNKNAPSWTTAVKEKIPELLAGIFALYAMLRSGKAYTEVRETASHPESGATADAEVRATASDAAKEEDLDLQEPRTFFLGWR